MFCSDPSGVRAVSAISPCPRCRRPSPVRKGVSTPPARRRLGPSPGQVGDGDFEALAVHDYGLEREGDEPRFLTKSVMLCTDPSLPELTKQVMWVCNSLERITRHEVPAPHTTGWQACKLQVHDQAEDVTLLGPKHGGAFEGAN